MSFFQTYRSTQGLDQFPPDQRFCVWRAAHSRLKAKDPNLSRTVPPIYCKDTRGHRSVCSAVQHYVLAREDRCYFP